MVSLSALQPGGVKHHLCLRGIVTQRVSFLLCLALIAQSSDPAQQANHPFVPARGQAFYLDLDSAAGAFSQWRHDELGSLIGLLAVLHVPRIRKDRQWFPTFSIGLQAKDGKTSANNLVFQVVALEGKLPMRMRLTGHVEGMQAQDLPLQTTLSLNEELKVEITWGTPQVITIRIGDAETHTVRVSWSVSSVFIAGSTGQLKIDPLLFGTVTP